MTDITDDVRDAVAASSVRDGICCVYSPHTTCSVRVNEFEQGFLEDFAVLLRRLVPSETYYAHDDWDRRTREHLSRGHGRRQRALTLHVDAARPGRRIDPGAGGRTLPRHVAAGVFLELDRERDRRWVVQVVGV